MAWELAERNIRDRLGPPSFEHVKDHVRYMGYEAGWMVHAMHELEAAIQGWAPRAKALFGTRWLHVANSQELTVQAITQEFLKREFELESDAGSESEEGRGGLWPCELVGGVMSLVWQVTKQHL